jgi:hypothetical protein
MRAREIDRPSPGQWAAQDLPQAATNSVRSNLPYSRRQGGRHQTDQQPASTNWRV